MEVKFQNSLKLHLYLTTMFFQKEISVHKSELKRRPKNVTGDCKQLKPFYWAFCSLSPPLITKTQFTSSGITKISMYMQGNEVVTVK